MIVRAQREGVARGLAVDAVGAHLGAPAAGGAGRRAVNLVFAQGVAVAVGRGGFADHARRPTLSGVGPVATGCGSLVMRSPVPETRGKVAERLLLDVFHERWPFPPRRAGGGPRGCPWRPGPRSTGCARRPSGSPCAARRTRSRLSRSRPGTNRPSAVPARAARGRPADAAAQSHQQRGIHGHQVGPADDGLGHVLRQRDAAGDDQGDLVPQAFLHQPPVHLAQGVLDVPAGPPAVSRSRPCWLAHRWNTLRPARFSSRMRPAAPGESGRRTETSHPRVDGEQPAGQVRRHPGHPAIAPSHAFENVLTVGDVVLATTG